MGEVPLWGRLSRKFLKMYLLISFRKSTAPQNQELIVYYCYSKSEVKGLGELTFYNNLIDTLCEIRLLFLDYLAFGRATLPEHPYLSIHNLRGGASCVVGSLHVRSPPPTG